jgi:AraC family transcriptional regulator
MIRANLAGDLRVADLAAECGMTLGALRAAFRKTAGVSPQEWLLQCRVQLAMELLRKRERPLEDVAALSGFANEAHLIRVFHRARGLHPDEWRAQLP